MRKINLYLEDLPGEIWKDIPGYEGLYKISSEGRLMSLERKFIRNNNKNAITLPDKLLKISTDHKGYKKISITDINRKRKTYRVHQLVAMTFYGHKISGYEMVINHKDSNPSNNNVNNLEVVTVRENIVHFYKNIKCIGKMTGINYNKIEKIYYAVIGHKGRYYNLGQYKNINTASEIYQIAVLNLAKITTPCEFRELCLFKLYKSKFSQTTELKSKIFNFKSINHNYNFEIYHNNISEIELNDFLIQFLTQTKLYKAILFCNFIHYKRPNYFAITKNQYEKYGW